MKRINLFIVFLFIFGEFVFSENLKFELVYQITDERLSRTLNNQGSGESSGPSGIAFDEEGNLYISSARNKLLLKYSVNDKTLITVLDSDERNAVTFAQSLYFENNIFWGFGGNGANYGLYNNVIKGGYSIDFFDSPIFRNLDSKSFYMTENYFFGYLLDGGIICIPYPSMDNVYNLSNILQNDQVAKFFNENTIADMDGLSIDENYTLYLNGELANWDYYHLVTYWAKEHGYTDFEKYRNDTRNTAKPYPLRNAQYVAYIGKDNTNNRYFRGSNDVLFIFNSDGWCIRKFDYRAASLPPTVDSEGNIYIFNFNSENDHNIELYKATNWPE